MIKILKCIFIIILFSNLANATSVSLIIDQAGISDNSFNSIAFNGLIAAKNEFGIATKVYQTNGDNNIKTIEKAVKEKNDIIIVLGYSLKSALETVAKKYINKRFILIDSFSNLKNILSVTFRNNEGSFLCGFLAASMSKTKKIGFIGGQKNPVIKNFFTGYKNGAKYADPNIKVISYYIGKTAEAWVDPVKAYQLTTKLCDQNTDVVFHASGNSGFGVIKAATDNKIFAIGVDKDQDKLAPGIVLTSMIKRIDVAVYSVIKDILHNIKPKNNRYSFGIKELAIDLTKFKYTKNIIPAKIRIQLAMLKLKILNNKLKVRK